MKPKRKRLDVIKEIINTQRISCQVDLLQPLKEAGIEVTQATLSRDLKQLKIAKMPDATGQYIYTLPNEMPQITSNDPAFLLHHKPLVGLGGFLSIDFSHNLVVIKTSPGLASNIAYNIDGGNSPEILGTVAGDDTIIVILREGVKHDQAYDILSKYIAALRSTHPDIIQ